MIEFAIYLLFSAGFIYFAFKALKGSTGNDGLISPNGSMICPNCGTRGEPKTITKGSLALEIVLWICFLVPGLIYSIWRLTSRVKGCPACGNTGVIGVDTPLGKSLISKINS